MPKKSKNTRRKREVQNDQTLIIKMDGFTQNVTVKYVIDPTFFKFSEPDFIRQFTPAEGVKLVITVSNYHVIQLQFKTIYQANMSYKLNAEFKNDNGMLYNSFCSTAVMMYLLYTLLSCCEKEEKHYCFQNSINILMLKLRQEYNL